MLKVTSGVSYSTTTNVTQIWKQQDYDEPNLYNPPKWLNLPHLRIKIIRLIKHHYLGKDNNGHSASSPFSHKLLISSFR